ncbi:MAG: methyl-accepting chemotaxis protein [Synergistaceae bacterium]|nr:methyl-accepting chemotaxis protein [Synergistaceae bacterium]
MEVVRGAAQNIDGKLDRIEGVLLTAAEAIRDSMTRKGGANREEVEKIVMALTSKMKGEDILFLYMGHEPDGKFSDGFGRKKPDDYDSRVRSWYKDAVQGGGRVILTDPYADSITGNIVTTMAVSIKDDKGALLGVVGLDMNLDGITEFVSNLGIFGKGNGILLLGDGTIMAGHRKEEILKSNLTRDEKFPEALRNVGKKMIAGGDGSEVYSYMGEEKQMFFSATRRGLPLGILFPTDELKALVRGLTFVLLAIAAVALVVVAVVVTVITRGLNRSIRSMEAATKRLGAGELAVRFDASGKDEIAAISRELNGMAASLQEVMIAIRRESDETAKHADTLASLSEETLSSMEEVSASIVKIDDVMQHSSSALEETNASIEEIASGAQAAARASAEGAEGASGASEAANASLIEVRSAASNIKTASEESENAIGKIRILARSVEEISGFVDTITSIADQTNLLALNAAIEAARAGEAGRGFAVVAEEVRKLAEESARAANQVNRLIEGLQKNSEESISATEKTGAILSETIRGVEATVQKLADAARSMSVVTQAVQNIAAVSEEQAASSEEMTSAVQSVTEATLRAVESMGSIKAASGETARAAEVIAAEAQAMAATSVTLSRLVDRFVIDEGGAGGLLPYKP